MNINLCELFGVEEGEVFELREFMSITEEYVIKDNVLLISKDGTGFGQSFITVNALTTAKVTRKPFKPKKGEIYYFVNAVSSGGYDSFKYQDDNTDKRVLSRVEVYRTKEEALAKVKELGW